MITPEEAKNYSHQFLEKHGLEVPPHLPILDEQRDLMPPSADDIARRLLVLGYLIGAAYNASPKEVKKLLKTYNLYGSLSRSEKKLLNQKTFSEKDKINASWLSECAEVLAWGLRLTDIDHFHKSREAYTERLPIKADPTSFIVNSKTRLYDEIYAQADLIFRLHWFAKQAHYDQQSCPLNWEIMKERHRAINWLVGEAPDWDEVTTDT